MPPLSARALNRATLARQLLLAREPLGVVDAVHRVVALQAQEPPSPYLALWARLERFDPAELDLAFADGSVVKATLMRITQHAVEASDYPAFHEAMQPTLRAARLNDRRFRRTGLTPDDADDLLSEVLAFASRPRTNAEAEAWFDERLGPTPKPGAWWAFRQYGPFVHASTGGAWSFGPRPSYIAARQLERSGDVEAAFGRLILRYLEGFGPATVEDIARFAMAHRPLVRSAVAAIEGGLVRLDGPGGSRLLDVPDGRLPDEDVPAPPRLLPMWDSVLLAHDDRGRMIPPAYRSHVTRTNGDVLPTLLVGGYVAGVWRPVEGGIEATAFHALPDDEWDGLDAEAARLAAFLATRDTAIYRRYVHWWSTLPAAEVRVLPT
ncbi:MAG TPA: winged helix DNA-binding domain-containing protein [Candidatus Dormibacteraeota bacterium]|nr:winged helix DNA-binding domain-containing protein [Candidatus Dormibacteraeota bacterium]